MRRRSSVMLLTRFGDNAPVRLVKDKVVSYMKSVKPRDESAVDVVEDRTVVRTLDGQTWDVVETPEDLDMFFGVEYDTE